MEKQSTKQRILTEAVMLFARDGYEAVTVEMIASAVGIKAPSLYKHYRSKQEIFLSILKEMERRDAENAAGCSVPQETMETDPQSYDHVLLSDIIEFSKVMFRYWTEDVFASAFRRMLTIEQFRSESMNALYHQYLGAGPLQYTADLLHSEEKALELYAPMHLLYSVYDQTGEPGKAYEMLSAHLDELLERWTEGNGGNNLGISIKQKV